MANKFFMKKSWVNVDMCIEDYYNSGTTLPQAKGNLNWSPYSNIIGKEVKFQRNTVEEIDEEKYNNKVKKSNGENPETKRVSLKDCKE
jgi:hypothetical protein